MLGEKKNKIAFSISPPTLQSIMFLCSPLGLGSSHQEHQHRGNSKAPSSSQPWFSFPTLSLMDRRALPGAALAPCGWHPSSPQPGPEPSRDAQRRLRSLPTSASRDVLGRATMCPLVQQQWVLFTIFYLICKISKYFINIIY